MIKLVKNWIEKQEIYMVLFGVLAIFIICKEMSTDVIFRSFISIIILPVFVWLIQIIMKRIISNNEFNIDVCLTTEVNSEVIWKLENEGDATKYSYILLENIGDINIYSLYIKVSSYTNTNNYYIIKEDLYRGKKKYVRVPYTLQDIKEISVSCGLPAEIRTKRFYGLKSGDNRCTIFGKCERVETKKKAIIFEKNFKENLEAMIKYRINSI